MKYFDIIKSSYGYEKQMWDAVAKVDDFLDKVAEKHPELVRKFKQEQYEAMNGKHINEMMAMKLVADMWHTASNGKMVEGEAVTVEQSQSLLNDMDVATKTKCKWDAYVAANAFAHDLADTGISQEQIIKAARKFWFLDEDMPKGNKVYWYFQDKMFG